MYHTFSLVMGLTVLCLAFSNHSFAQEQSYFDFESNSINNYVENTRNTDDYTKPDFDRTNPKDISDNFHKKMAIPSPIVSQQVKNYKLLLEHNNSFRYQGLNFLEELMSRLESKGKSFVLTNEDLDFLTLGTGMLLDIRENIYGFVNQYRVISAFNDYNRFLKIGNILLDEEKKPWYNPDEVYSVKTGTDEGRLFAKKLGVSLHAALTLYDNYFLLISLYENIDPLRETINQGNSGYGVDAGKIREISRRIKDFKFRKGIAYSLKLFDRYVKRELKKNPDLKDQELKDLIHLINKSASVDLFRSSISKRSWTMLSERVNGFVEGLHDSKNEALRIATNGLSMIFGNAVGLIEFRKGYLYDQEKPRRIIQKNLEPLDVLFEKTPFRPTDKFIPGHWGHVAIWIGSIEDLQEAGLWDLILATEEWKRIAIDSEREQEIIDHLSNDRVILEALRPGVQLNDLKHFMNVDDFAAIRPNYKELMSPEEKAKTIARALGNYGKDYDFNFDVSTIDKIVCSELAYQTYFGIEWPTERTFGRYSITPDQISMKALEGTPFQVVELWHQGNRVSGDKAYLDLAYQLLYKDSSLMALVGDGNWEPRPATAKEHKIPDLNVEFL